MNTYTHGQKLRVTRDIEYGLAAKRMLHEGEEVTYNGTAGGGFFDHNVTHKGYAVLVHDSEVQPQKHTPTEDGTEVTKEELEAHLQTLTFCVGEVPSGINREEGDRAIEALRAALFPEGVAGA